MTKLVPDDMCPSCGGMLVPPIVASMPPVPTDTDFVCLTCRRPFRWTAGNPPKLTLATIHLRRLTDE